MKAILVKYNNLQSHEIVGTIDVMHHSTALPKYVNTLEKLYATDFPDRDIKLNYETYTSHKDIKHVLKTLGLSEHMEEVCRADGCIYSNLTDAIKAVTTIVMTCKESDASQEFYMLCVEDRDMFMLIKYPDIISKSIHNLVSGL